MATFKDNPRSSGEFLSVAESHLILGRSVAKLIPTYPERHVGNSPAEPNDWVACATATATLALCSSQLKANYIICKFNY